MRRYLLSLTIISAVLLGGLAVLAIRGQVRDGTECVARPAIVYVRVGTTDGDRAAAIPPDGSCREMLSGPKRSIFWPRWSPDGSLIAWRHSFVLQVNDTKGNALWRIGGGKFDGGDGRWVWDFAWSPDGQHLALLAQEDLDSEIAVMVVGADGSGLANLTAETGLQVLNGWVSWRPDGSQIAFSAADESGQLRIFGVAPDGIALAPLTPASGPGGQRMYASSHPAWSPDGGFLAFEEIDRLYVMAADGSGIRMVSPADEQLFPEHRWSPDSTRIALGTTGGMYIVNADGTGLLRLSDGTATDSSPSWSPDGRQLVFHSSKEGLRDQLWIINDDGTGRRQLTTDGGVLPDWSWAAVSEEH